MTALILKTPSVLVSGGLGHYKDAVLTTGVKFLFDLGSVAGWPSQAAPAGGATIPDIAGVGNGSVSITAGQTVAFSGGGFDWTGVTADDDAVKAPSGVLSSIFSGNQYFLVAFYARLPASGDWNTDTTRAAMFCTTATEAGFDAPEADLLMIGQSNGVNIDGWRSAAVGARSSISVSAAAHAGLVTQVAYYRTAAGIAIRLCSSAGISITEASAGAANTGDFSAKIPQWGITKSFNDMTKAAHRSAAKWRLYRGWIEDLVVSGRAPVTVLDADYLRTVARGVYS